MLGRWMSDLDTGDELAPVHRAVTPFLIREYAHAVEDAADRHQQGPDMIAPPTFIHAEKKRLLEHSCPDGVGPTARMHLSYDAVHHAVIPAGTVITTQGRVTDRFEKKGREHVVIEIEVRDKVTGQVYTTYTDSSLLNFTPGR